LKPRRGDIIAVVVLLLLALIFCGRAVFTGRSMMPLDMLLLMSPWRANVQTLAPGFMMPQNPLLDPVQQYYPWRVFAVDALKSGVIPLWNPYSYCGQPFLANLQSALFYPLNLIFLILPLPLAFTFGAVLHLFLAGLFTYALLREWKLLPLAALVGAIAFMFNGYSIGWLEYPAFGQWVIIWLPAVLLCYEKFIARKDWRWGALTGAALAMQFLGGQLQLSIYIVLTFGLYAIWRTCSMGKKQEFARYIGCALVLLAAGIALSAVQLLPTAELAPLSARPPKLLQDVLQARLPISHLILYLIPNFFGNPAQGLYWGDQIYKSINFFETGCYVGIITLLLAWLTLRMGRKPIIGFLLALVVISLLLALGSPLFWLFFHIVPGVKQLAGLARVLCLTAFGLAGLAAFGLNRLLTKEPALAKWELPAFGTVAALAAVLAFSWALAFSDFAAALWKQPPLLDNFRAQGLRFVMLLVISLVLVGLLGREATARRPDKAKKQKHAAGERIPALQNTFAFLIPAFLAFDLFLFGIGFNPATDAKLAFPPTQATDFLRAEGSHQRMVSYRPVDSASKLAWLQWMPPNTPLAYQLRDTHGYDSLTPGRYMKLLGTTEWSAQGNWPSPDSPLVDLLGIEYALTTDELKAPRWELVKSVETNIYRNREALPRAFLVGKARQVGDEESLELVKTGGFDFRNEVLLNTLPGAPRINQAGPVGEVKFLTDGINAVTVEANPARDSWLVLTDSAYAGWQAEIDGRAAQWQIADYAFRAVPLTPGRHSIKWSYQPAVFKAGLFISLFALAVLCSVFGYFWRRIKTHE